MAEVAGLRRGGPSHPPLCSSPQMEAEVDWVVLLRAVTAIPQALHCFLPRAVVEAADDRP